METDTQLATHAVCDTAVAGVGRTQTGQIGVLLDLKAPH